MTPVPTALRLLETYRDGIVAQIQIIAKFDQYDSMSRAPSKSESLQTRKSDYEIAKEMLREVEAEIDILKSY
jgi:hypothetical protein